MYWIEAIVFSRRAKKQAQKSLEKAYQITMLRFMPFAYPRNLIKKITIHCLVETIAAVKPDVSDMVFLGTSATVLCRN
jgi:hypothetical protein